MMYRFDGLPYRRIARRPDITIDDGRRAHGLRHQEA